jgi:hypothetical protein
MAQAIPSGLPALECEILSLRLRHTFRIARSVEDVAESVVLHLAAGGTHALGESAPTPRYGETPISSQVSSLRWTSPASSLLGSMGHSLACPQTNAGPCARSISRSTILPASASASPSTNCSVSIPRM